MPQRQVTVGPGGLGQVDEVPGQREEDRDAQVPVVGQGPNERQSHVVSVVDEDTHRRADPDEVKTDGSLLVPLHAPPEWTLLVKVA